MTLVKAVHGDNNLDYGGGLVLTREVGRDPNDRNGEDFRRFPHAKIVRLNHGYGKAGTLPQRQHYADFAQRVAHYVEASPGCSRWIIGNEPNVSWERPDGQPITPAMYAECYTLCRDAIHALPFHSGDQVLLAAVGPWNVDTKYAGNPSGDWIRYFQDVQVQLVAGGCDGFALHTYCRAQTRESIVDEAKMDAPFDGYYKGFRAYRDWMGHILPRFQGLPVYITEFCVAGAPWQNANAGCIQEAYREIGSWNDAHPDRPISWLTAYRWTTDQWRIDDKPLVQEDFLMAGADTPDPPEENDAMLNPSFELPYHRDLQHSTVNVAHDWTYFASNGKPPERDGPCALPEYKCIYADYDPQLVVDGGAAQCWFIRWKIMDAGVYQRMAAKQGHTYQLDAMCKAWCTNGDDTGVSDGDMHVMLGIDPAGGTDPWAATVQWTEWQRAGASYKRYYSEQVEAEAGHITVFVRAWNKWELSHNDFYIDDAHLVESGGGEPPVGGDVDYAYIRQIVREEIDRTIWAAGAPS